MNNSNNNESLIYLSRIFLFTNSGSQTVCGGSQTVCGGSQCLCGGSQSVCGGSQTFLGPSGPLPILFASLVSDLWPALFLSLAPMLMVHNTQRCYSLFHVVTRNRKIHTEAPRRT
jgi:hypothetical protein